eukprot:8737067-Karenia_brevis.AAC.1
MTELVKKGTPMAKQILISTDKELKDSYDEDELLQSSKSVPTLMEVAIENVANQTKRLLRMQQQNYTDAD